ncbi:MAG TPA: BatA domain-containing protein [Hymenobacter sp.]|uniref:BatA domain-containing protein n=1 Tax=Hymenobacter sp. TaxID=1898978 RepID=UPI002D7EAEDA|nr:BatA domain-containing protein [Hymenobacter sp.]HET9505114.1 BatA domain-containing protein [Hymenobacter sp.]
MLTFANPSALLALLGLLVPLAIHLWNRRPGREVAVGSLRWLATGANRRLRNLRLEQLGLLLLRAAAVAVLAAAVAGPAWRQPLPPGRGQVLISPDLASENVLAAVRPRLDSLRRRGYAVRWLSKGLPPIADIWRADSAGNSLSAKAMLAIRDTGSYEARIRQAADTFAGQPLYVLTSARLAAMQGTHRPLPPGITWQTLPLPIESMWLQAATATADSLHLVIGRSNERQTTFGPLRTAHPQPSEELAIGGPPTLYYALKDSLLLPRNPIQPAVPVRPAALRAWVYAPPAYAAEARYLRAALRAASVGLPGPLAVTVSPSLPGVADTPDWLFWLSAAPVPAAWRARVLGGLHLWQAPAGPGTPDTSLLVAPGLAAEVPATLWRRAALAASASTETLWADAQGRPVLTRRALGRGAVYQAATLINPTWSTLADNPALPALLLDVLQPAPAGAALARLQAHDQRRLDATQLPKPQHRAPGTAIPPTFRLLDLRPWLVLLAGLLLALERGLAARRGASTSLSPA